MSGPCRRWRPAPFSDEGRARQRVVEALAARFPHEEQSSIEERVDAAWDSLGTASVRDFVPTLVARAVGEQLQQEHRCRS